MVRTRRKEYESKREQYILQQLKGHPRAFWKWWSSREDDTVGITPDEYRDHLHTTLGSDTPMTDINSSYEHGGFNVAHNAALSSLDHPFSVHEVVQAIYKLRNGRSASDGLQAELLRWARDPNVELPNAAASWVKYDLTTC